MSYEISQVKQQILKRSYHVKEYWTTLSMLQIVGNDIKEFVGRVFLSVHSDIPVEQLLCVSSNVSSSTWKTDKLVVSGRKLWLCLAPPITGEWLQRNRTTQDTQRRREGGVACPLWEAWHQGTVRLRKPAEHCQDGHLTLDGLPAMAS